jgi:hypothetical protein
MLSDSVYFHRRAEEERAAAEQATNALAREVHLELATRYERAAAATRTNVIPFEARRAVGG